MNKYFFNKSGRAEEVFKALEIAVLLEKKFGYLIEVDISKFSVN